MKYMITKHRNNADEDGMYVCMYVCRVTCLINRFKLSPVVSSPLIRACLKQPRNCANKNSLTIGFGPVRFPPRCWPVNRPAGIVSGLIQSRAVLGLTLFNLADAVVFPRRRESEEMIIYIYHSHR